MTTLNPTEHWSHWRPWGQLSLQLGTRRLTCLTCLGDEPRRLSCLSLLRDPSERDPRKSTCLSGLGIQPGKATPQHAQVLPVQGVPGGQPALSCLEIGPLGVVMPHNFIGDPPLQESQRSTLLDPPRTPISQRSTRFDLLGDSIPEAVMPQLAQIATHPGMPYPVGYRIGQISFKKTHPKKSTHGNMALLLGRCQSQQ